MRLEELQEQRNNEAKALRDIEDIEERRKEAFKLGNKYERLASKHGFITQSYYWIHVHAGLKDNA